MAPKGFEIFNDFHRHLLVHGSRLSSKSLSICHKVCRHLWENNEAQAGLLTRTLRNAKTYGVWTDLTEIVLPLWHEAGFGMKYTLTPRMTADTKMSHFKVNNMHGTESEMQLCSLDHDEAVEEKFKGTRFSLLYISEADQFTNRMVFDTLFMQMRSLTVPESEWQVILDCNPPENGEAHCLFDMFFRQVDFKGEPLDPKHKATFHAIQCGIDDNPYLSEERRTGLKNQFAYDPTKYARFVEGKWVADTTLGVFEKHFVHNIHVVGNASSPREDDWEIIIPSQHCTELYTGWDLGDTNHAAVIMCKRDLLSNSAWDVIDELAVIDHQVSIREFTEQMLDKMDYWEALLKERYGRTNIHWRHWSDSSAMRYRAAIDSDEQLVVRQASQGRIVLQGFLKTKYSVSQRLDLTRRLLFEKRLFISARCRHVIAMLGGGLKPGRHLGETVDRTSKHKHIFDAMTYLLASESPADVERRISPTTSSKPVLLTL